MLVLLWVILSQSDPNGVYQGLSRADKERVYLVYEQELARRQNVEKAVAATEAATGKPKGAIRLVALEMKRDVTIAQRRKDEARGLTGKNAKKADKSSTTTPKRQRTPRSSSSGGGSGSRSQRVTTVTKKEYSGEGITKVEGEEQVKFDGKDREIQAFTRLCRFVLPAKVELTEEKVAIVVDGFVKQSKKDWTLIGRTAEDGSEYAPLVVMHAPSTKQVEGLRKGDLVRLWGWIADESQIKAAEDAIKEEKETPTVATDDEEEEEESSDEELRPSGLVFFVMDVDKSTRVVPNLAVTCQVMDVERKGDRDLEWEVTVEATNSGDVAVGDVEIEANLVVDRTRPKEGRDTTFVYFERIEPGKSASFKLRIKNWVEKEIEVMGMARVLSGKAISG